jgi:hypothetical protein
VIFLNLGKMKKYLIAFYFLVFMGTTCTWAQPYLYFAGNDGAGYGLGYINLATCEYCINFNINASSGVGAIQDVIPMPNGDVVTISQDGNFNVFTPPDPTPISTFSTGLTPGGGAILSLNGTIYYFTVGFNGGIPESCLYEFDPASNTNTNLGCANDVILSDLFFWNGILYAFGTNGQPNPTEFGLYSIVIEDPLVVTLEETYSSVLCGGATAAIPGVGIYTSVLDPDCDGAILYNFDLPGNTTAFECDLNPAGFPYGLSEIPESFPLPPSTCGCITKAGEVSSTNNILCPNENFSFGNSGSELDPDDALQFILFSDLLDTLGSILLTSSSSVFTFSDPPLTTGVTYYVAAIAGNGLPDGNVDLTDPCLDISNAIETIWNPYPSVMFSVANPDVCAGNCTDVTATFTGTPPFTLSYTTSGNPPTNLLFTGNTGTFQVCVDADAPAGNLVLQATSLVDAYCTCN